MKYFGCKSRQDFFDTIYEVETSIFYKDVEYIFWLDGNGYNIGLTYINNRETSEEEHEKSIASAKSYEELVEKYVLYDGVKLSDALEMDIEDIT